MNRATVPFGGCAGHLDPGEGIPVRVHVGDTISVEAGELFPLPRPDHTEVIAMWEAGPHKAVYHAVAPGISTLLVRTLYCGTFTGSLAPPPEQWQVCPTLVVLVRA